MTLLHARCAVALLFSATLSAAALPQVDFTGTWILDVPTVQASTAPVVLTIVHTGDHIQIVRADRGTASPVLAGPLDGSVSLTWAGSSLPLTDARPAWVGRDLVFAGRVTMPNGVVVEAQRTLTLTTSDALRITEVLNTGTTQFTRTETFSRQRR